MLIDFNSFKNVVSRGIVLREVNLNYYPNIKSSEGLGSEN